MRGDQERRRLDYLCKEEKGMVDLGKSECQWNARTWVKGKGCRKKGKRNVGGERWEWKSEKPSEDQERACILIQRHALAKDWAKGLTAWVTQGKKIAGGWKYAIFPSLAPESIQQQNNDLNSSKHLLKPILIYWTFGLGKGGCGSIRCKGDDFLLHGHCWGSMSVLSKTPILLERQPGEPPQVYYVLPTGEAS